MLGKVKLNYTPSPLDTRDHIIHPVAKGGLETVDLSSHCSSVKNQGAIGSCTAHAGVGLMEYFYRRFLRGKDQDLFSEKFLYYVTRVDIAGWPANDDSGAYIRDTLKAMVKYGVALEQTVPYVRDGEKDCRYADSPAPSAYREAEKFQVAKYARISESSRANCLQECKNLLANNYAFMGGFICYENVFDGANGVIPEPKGAPLGGHAVLFVGYDDKKQLFKFKNSWGTSWGDKGYGYLPYSFLASGNMFDLWTVYEQEHENKVYGIVTPKSRKEEYDEQIRVIMEGLGNGLNVNEIKLKMAALNSEQLGTADKRQLDSLLSRMNILLSSTKQILARMRL